jgi:RHS repeat-associated protein
VTNGCQYDSLNRLTNLVWKYHSTGLGSFYYQLGKSGNRTNLSEVVNAVGRSYGWMYDNLYRMTNEAISGIGGVGYQFDPVGNCTNRQSSISQLTTTNYDYDTNDWLVGDIYDTVRGQTGNGNGNTIGSGSVSYTYDVLNRMLIGGGTSFAYDVDGNRIAEATNSVATYYLVDDRNPTGYPQVLEEYRTLPGSGAPALLSRVYNYGLGLISQQQFNTNTLLPSVTSYYGFDGHGSVRFLTDTNQNITDTYAYDAYGTLIATNGSIPNNYLYCGEQFDPTLGMYYLRARYYKPDTGRFWTMDTYQGDNRDPLSLHRYLYSRNDSVNIEDHSGHDWFGIAMDFINPIALPSKLILSPLNGPPTHVGDILSEFFAIASKERVWIMGPNDHYTQIVQKWKPLMQIIEAAKTDLRKDPGQWKTTHETTSWWIPSGSSINHDPKAWPGLVLSPPGTDPGTAAGLYINWKNSGYQPEKLYTAAIGSFEVYVTVDKINTGMNSATLKIWMYNQMSRESFGLGSLFPGSGMANQWMWWDWTEDYSW